MTRIAIAIFSLVVFFTGLSIGQAGARNIHGAVRDEQGSVIVGAHIVLEGSGYRRLATSGRDGSFLLEGAPQEALNLTADAPGFAHFTLPLAPDAKDQVDIVLSPAPVWQEINVTANRVSTAEIETAESMRTLTRSEL